jgi:hypothetical protein
LKGSHNRADCRRSNLQPPRRRRIVHRPRADFQAHRPELRREVARQTSLVRLRVQPVGLDISEGAQDGLADWRSILVKLDDPVGLDPRLPPLRLFDLVRRRSSAASSRGTPMPSKRTVYVAWARLLIVRPSGGN